LLPPKIVLVRGCPGSRLARVLRAGLLSQPVLQMRTLVAAEARRFPEVAADYVTSAAPQ